MKKRSSGAQGASIMETQLTRRSLIYGTGLTAALTLLAGCAPAKENEPTSAADSGAQSAASTTATAAAFGTEGKLRAGMECSYVPFNWQVSVANEYTVPIENVAGTYADGFDVQVTKRVADALGLEPVVVKVEFDGLIEALANGQIDCIIAGMTATPEREESIDFSDPYFVSSFGLMVLKGSPYEKATSLADFAGASVMGTKASLLDTLIDEIPDVNHMLPANTVPDQLERLQSGACDAITFDVMNAEGMVAAHPDFVPIIFDKGKGFSQEIPVNVGIAKGQDEVLAQINAALAAFTEEQRAAEWQAATERQPA